MDDGADDPAYPRNVAASHQALVQLLRMASSETLRQLGTRLDGGSLKVSPVSYDINGEGSCSVKLMVPAEGGLVTLTSEEDSELREMLRGVVHAGDVYVGFQGIFYDVDQVAWRRRTERAPLQGRIGDRYKIVRSIGRGGCAVVYLAEDVLDGTQVALKVLSENDNELYHEQHLHRMGREMRILQRFEHDHVVKLIWFGQLEDGRLWYTMPFASATLKDRLLTLEASDAEVLVILDQIADGIDFLHGNDIIHRDLTPANVLLLEDRWVVSDFGLAVNQTRESEVLTGTGWGLGTPHYRPPEFQTAKSATAAWDVYSLGVICLDLITGRPANERSAEVFPDQHPFAPAIRQATAFDPSNRFETAGAFVEECRRLLRISSDREWEPPSQRLERIARQLGDDATRRDAADELASVLAEDPEVIDGLVRALAQLDEVAMGDLAATRPASFQKIVDTAYRELPTSFTRFDHLDPMGDFFQTAGSVGEDDVAVTALSWLARIGYEWNRYHVQRCAEGLANDLTENRPHLLKRALDGLPAAAIAQALPEIEALHPEARPMPPSSSTAAELEVSAFDEEPF